MKYIFQFIYIYILVLLINHSISELIIFPFRTINTKSNSSFNFISKLYTNELYTDIKLGTPESKIISTIISTEQIAFSVNENSYQIKNSSYYNESTLPKPRSFVWEKIDNAILFQDMLFINTTNITNITKKKKINEKNFTAKFLYVENQTYNYIGLNFPDLYEHNVISIFKTLKENKLIDNYQWCPKINKKINKTIDFLNIDGELIFGGNCNDYLPEKFKKEYITEFDMYSHGQYVEYTIKFTKIYVGDQIDKNNLYYNQVYFGLNFLNIGSLEYETKVANLFFNDWIQKNVCFLEAMDINPDIHYYYCNINLDIEKKFDLSLFPKLCLGIENINTTFCFDDKDLFVQDPNNKDIIYFLFGFMKFDPINDYSKYFHFGVQFLTKYQLSFDPKYKKIYFYDVVEGEDKDKDKDKGKDKDKDENKDMNKEDEGNNTNYVLLIIIIIILCILLVAIGMLIQKKLTKVPRKIRANELGDENFLYEQKE